MPGVPVARRPRFAAPRVRRVTSAPEARYPAAFPTRPIPVTLSTVAASSPATLAAAAAAVLVLQLGCMDTALLPYDEGIVLLGADRVLRGDVPYRDFWTLYGPATFYLPAAVFRLFGETVLVERLLDALFRTLIVAAAWSLVRRIASERIAWWVAGAELALLVGIRAYGAPVFPATAGALLALLALDRGLARDARSLSAAAGAAAGAATLFRHDFGLYALIACATLFLPRAGGGPARRGPHAIAFAAGLLVVVLPAAAALLAAVAPGTLVRDLLTIPLDVYPRVRSLPFPSPLALGGTAPALWQLEALVVYLPPTILVVAAPVWWRAARAGREDAQAAPLALAGMVLAALLYQKGLVRVSPLHVAPALIVSLPVFASILPRVRAAALRRALGATALVGIAALVGRALLLRSGAADDAAASVGTDAPHRALGLAWPETCRASELPRLRCVRLDPAREAMARWLLEHGARNQRVYFGTGRHDKLLVGDTSLPFAAETVSPTRWHDLHPGIQTTREVQAEMVAELQAAPPRFVVIDRVWDDAEEPNESARSSGVTLLDDWLALHYRPVWRAAELSVLEPREAAP
jgi:hypothetical protein